MHSAKSWLARRSVTFTRLLEKSHVIRLWHIAPAIGVMNTPRGGLPFLIACSRAAIASRLAKVLPSAQPNHLARKASRITAK